MVKIKKTDPVLVMIIGYVLGVLLVLMFAGCGTNKVKTQITQTEANRDAQIKIGGESTEVEQSAGRNEETSQSAKSSEAAKTTVNRQYDPVTGKLINETTTTENKKKSGTKNSNKVNVQNYKRTRTESKHQTITTHVTQTTKQKDKESERTNTLVDQLGGPWVMLGIVLIISLVIAGYKYVTRKPKVTEEKV